MYETSKTTKYSADKVAFLVLFVAALLAARLITVFKSSVTLSEPIKLRCADLSVSIPAGNGWRNEKQWQYKENAFTLSSIFTPSPGSATAMVRYRYLLAAPKTTPDERFKQKAFASDASIEKTGAIEINIPSSGPPGYSQEQGLLAIEWAHIKKQKTPFDILFGTIQLPNNRQFDIEVHDVTGDTFFIEQLFERIVESIKLSQNLPLTAGSEVVTEIKDTGIGQLMENQSSESFFLIKEDMPGVAEQQTVGFTMDVLAHSDKKASDNEAMTNIHAISFYYIKGRHPQEHAAFFQGDNSFDEFSFSSRTNPTGVGVNISTIEVSLDKTGTMTVTRPHKLPPEKTFQPSPATIPEFFVEQLLSQMIDSKHKEIIVDIIDADGKIIPTLLSKIELETTSATEKAAYALRMQFMDGRGLCEKIYLNKQKKIIKILLEKKLASGQTQSIYTLDRTDLKNILNIFPERAEYIFKSTEMLRQKRTGPQQFF